MHYDGSDYNEEEKELAEKLFKIIEEEHKEEDEKDRKKKICILASILIYCSVWVWYFGSHPICEGMACNIACAIDGFILSIISLILILAVYAISLIVCN